MTEPAPTLRPLLLVLVLAYVAVAAAERLPTPRPADAPPGAFAEGRARPLLVALADGGPRVPGAPAYARAVATLAAELRALPGVEVEVVDIAGSDPDPDSPRLVRAYRAVNVLARLRGRDPAAVLLSAHFDSPAESPGAGDDAVGVAVAVEALRALAADPTRERSIVVNLNGAEESGTLGADAFLDHPWRADVVAAINLEATPDGRALAFQADPNGAWLLDAYAAEVTRPHASGVAEDLFRSGLLGHYTDFRVYSEEAAIPTLDLASYGDFWAYHTPLDTAERVRPGVLQHMGDCTLELARGLSAAGPPEPGRALYTDVLGRFTLRTPTGAAVALALAASLLALFGALRLRRAGARVGELAGALLRLSLGTALAVIAPALAGALLVVLGQAQLWYAAPAWGVLGFTLVAAAAALVPLAGARAAQLPAVAASAWWSLLAVLAAARSLTVGLVLLAFALPAALAALARRPGWAWAVSLSLGTVLVLQHARMFTTMFVAEAGLLELPFAFDPILGAVLGLPVAALLPGVWPLVATRARLRRDAAVLALLGVVAFGVAAAQPRYTAERPKRVFLAHGEEHGVARLAAAPYDAVGFPPALIDALELAPEAREVLWFSTTHARPAGLTGLTDPSPRIVELARDPDAGTRRIRLHVDARDATDLLLRFPPGVLAAWSLDTPPPAIAGADSLLWVVQPESAYSLELTLATLSPIAVEVTAIDALGRSAELAAAVAALPAWATPHTRRYRRAHVRG